ncbi:uncharacterized protein LOC116046401, partial [Scomber scombrus]
DQFTQVASQPDLDDDTNWIEIKWPTRKEPNRTVPAKVGDIWAEEESRGVHMKNKMCETEVVKPKMAIQ